MVFSFFTSLPASEGEEELIDRKKIAKHYLTGWFSLEFLAIVPIDPIFNLLLGYPCICGVGTCMSDIEDPTLPANVFLRVPRFLKLSKGLRLLKMLKLFKLIRNQQTIEKQFQNRHSYSKSLIRLGLMILTAFYAQHILTCIWVFIGTQESLVIRDGWLNPTQVDKGTMATYVRSLYFILTTMTTVGYGDMTVNTPIEQCFSVIVMISGIGFFATIAGSLSCILASMDH
jgi:hypothetical protein